MGEILPYFVLKSDGESLHSRCTLTRQKDKYVQIEQIHTKYFKLTNAHVHETRTRAQKYN